MALVRDTVAIPVTKGINVNTPARLVDAQELLEAQNVRFVADVGARKRRGHNGQKVRGAKPLPAGWVPPTFAKSTFVAPYYTDDRGIDSDWLLGYGYTASTVLDATAALPTSEHPDGLALGMAGRDNESLVWDGHRLLSRTSLSLDGGRFTELPAVMPALHSEPFAKANVAQNSPDVADNGTIKVAVWVSDGQAYYSVFDSTNGALIDGPVELYDLGVVAVRAVPIGPWVHIFVSSTDSSSLEIRSIHSSTPTSPLYRSLGDCNGYFDVWNHQGANIVVAQSRGTEVMIRWLETDGSLVVAHNKLIDVGGDTGITSVAVCADPQTGNYAVAWRTATQVKAAQFDPETGAVVGSTHTLATVTAAGRAVAISPRWLKCAGEDVFNVYWDDWSSTDNYSTIGVSRWTKTAGSVYSATAYNLLLGSQGFRVGDRAYIWACRNSTYQSTWVLLDETLRPVGHGEYVTADTPSGADHAYTLFSVNWTGDAPEKDRCVYHFALSTRVRVAVEPTAVGENPPPVYSEPYIKFATIDFLPPLRSAQAGRSTYFAGAQLWSYDGAELTEANFLFAPEDVTVAATTVTDGDLTASGQYIWRVDLCYRNAQNEEIRSASFYTDSLALSGDQNAATLTIPTCLTRRDDAYFLIFRNQSAGTVWNLCNSRDPLSPLFLRNDQTVRQVTFTDSTVTDTELLSREQHPNQSFDYLDPFMAPACEVIAAGRDRLWLAGGEVPAGQVQPSRLFDPGEVPAFHGNLAIQVDRSAEPITAIGFVGDYTVFFRQTQAYILDNDGPDNISVGDWNKPRDSEAKLGALTQESVATVAGGIVFQSPAGIRQFTPGGGVVPFGQSVDDLAKDMNITATVVISKDQEVRFYDWDGTTLVFNYQYGRWSTWTISAAGAIRDPQTNLAVVVTPQGLLLREAEDVWTDNGGVYKMRVRFAWLRAGGLLDFQQVRRIGAVGEGTAHKLHVDVYYNEREFAEEWFDWEVPDDGVQNTDTFGANNFGDGNFGDTAAIASIQLHDSTWPWRRRLFRRKCSVISVAIDDAYTNGEGFTLTALALELAKKPGLDRTPWAGGTYSNTGGNGSSETGN